MLGMASSKVETNRDKHVAELFLRVLRAEKRTNDERALLATEIAWLANQQSITPDTLSTMTESDIVEFFEGMIGVAETSRGIHENAFLFDVVGSKTPAGRRWTAIANKVARAFDS